MSPELNDILELPKYEARCNLFVAKINEKVAGKYPDLEIRAENDTRESMNRPALVQGLAINTELKDRMMSALRRDAEVQDRLSAHCNIATVDISAYEARLKGKLFQATQDVIRIAKGLHSATPQITRDIDKIPLNMHFYIEFS